MKSILDSAYAFYLGDILYRGSGSLQVILIEAFVKQEQVDIQITENSNLKCYPIKPTESSRQFTISFEHVIAWQVIDESWYNFDENEIRDSLGTLQVIQNSKYFEYINKYHGWYIHSIGPAKHYRIGTENEVIDVVSCEEPHIQESKTNR
ncbi:hypothetical protein [Pontibacter ruber]|uniref:Uncharacterized protein n=1 Tax=Pontibacter ruber TaxID=1343895 RepID=A0ABW5CY38_9BACT|nr:hypothetical protein [Pontibacter ruber]